MQAGFLLTIDVIGWGRGCPDLGRPLQDHIDCCPEKLTLCAHPCAFQNQRQAPALSPRQSRKNPVQVLPIRRGNASSFSNFIDLGVQGTQVKRNTA